MTNQVIPTQAVEAACVSNFHEPATPATVHGTYANGRKVWYCDPCAVMGESVGLFTRDEQA